MPSEDVDCEVNAGFARVMREFYWEPTSLIYTCAPKDVEPSSTYTDGFKVWEKPGDYGEGLEDCAILGGVALGGVCDEYDVTRNEELRVPALKGDICRVLSEVADRMTEQVTEANDWSYRQAVGNGPTRGICKMRFNRPHEGMRLTMVYAAAWAVTGEKRYFDLYRKYLDEGVAKSMELAQMTPQKLASIRGAMPDYSLLQMQLSLELVAKIERDPVLRRKVETCMVRPAEIAADRARALGTGDTQYLCGCGELSLAQTIAGRGDCETLERTLVACIRAQPFADRASCCRIVHLFGAWWRFRRLACCR